MWNKKKPVKNTQNLEERISALTGAVNELSKVVRWQMTKIQDLQNKVVPALVSLDGIVRQVDYNVYQGFAPKKKPAVKKKSSRK